MAGFIEYVQGVWGGALPGQLMRAILIAALFELLVFAINRYIRAKTAPALRQDLGKEAGERVRRRRIVQGMPMLVNRAVLYTVALLMILRTFRVQTEAELLPALVIIVVAALVIAKDALRDCFSGWLIVWDDLYSPGDRVTIGEHRGTVTDLTLRHTRLRTRDGRELVIPNSKVALISNDSAEDGG